MAQETQLEKTERRAPAPRISCRKRWMSNGSASTHMCNLFAHLREKVAPISFQRHGCSTVDAATKTRTKRHLGCRRFFLPRRAGVRAVRAAWRDAPALIGSHIAPQNS